MSRRAARVAAVEILYAADLRSVVTDDVLAEREDVDPYTSFLVAELGRHGEEVDRLIASHSVGWAPERMSTVDRNILRIGTLELLQRDVPPAAVIDEAVEIAKRFSGTEAGRFVNGVLAAVLQELSGRSSGSSEESDGGGALGGESVRGSSGSGDGGGGAAGAGGDGGGVWSGRDGSETGGAGGGGIGGGGAGGGGAGGGGVGLGGVGTGGAGAGCTVGRGGVVGGGGTVTGAAGAGGVVTTTGEVTGAAAGTAGARREIL